MKTKGNEFFYNIPGLLIPKNNVYDLLEKDLNFFVDWVQNNIGILHYLAENHIEAFAYELSMVREILQSIYAHWLDSEAEKMLKLAEAGRRSMCKSMLGPFIVNAQTLAIDIQLAEKSGFPTTVKNTHYVEIGRYKDALVGIGIVRELVELSDFEKAFDMANCIDDVQKSDYAVSLMTGIAKKKKEYILKLIDEIVDIYNGKIDSINVLSTESRPLKKILIVDDMPEILGVLNQMLSQHYKVYAFTNAAEALNFIDKKETPDAFLLDIDMPEINGFTLAKKIREREKYAKTPLVFLTGDSARNTVIKSLLYGATAFIVKPASKDLIIEKLSGCFT